MSMEENMIDLFKRWHKENKWSERKTVDNLLAIYGVLEWNMLDLNEEPTDKDGETDWNKYQEMEFSKAKMLLFG